MALPIIFYGLKLLINYYGHRAAPFFIKKGTYSNFKFVLPLGWSDCSVTCGENGIQKMMFECQPPDNELFYDCGMKPISVRQCPPQPPCIIPGMAIWVVKFSGEGYTVYYTL